MKININHPTNQENEKERHFIHQIQHSHLLM